MKYIKQSQLNNLLFYNNQFNTAQPVTIFKIYSTSIDFTKYISVTKTANINTSSYALTTVPNLINEDVENGIVYIPSGGIYNFEVYEAPAYTTNTVNLTMLWSEQMVVDQLNDAPLSITPKSIFLFGVDYRTDVKLYNGSTYIYNTELFRFVGSDGYVSVNFEDELDLGYFERVSSIQTWTLATYYLDGRLLYSGSTLYLTLNRYTSSGSIATDILDGNLIEISGSGGGGGDFLPLAGGTMTGDILVQDDLGEWVIQQTDGIFLNLIDFYTNGGIDLATSNGTQSVNISMNPNANTIQVGQNTGTGFIGITYTSDYSPNYTNRSLVDKYYVDNAIANAGGVARETFTVTNVADLTGLTTSNQGDVGIVTSTNESYILTDPDYTNLANWELILAPDSVISVNGQTGVVVLTTGDILPTVGEDWIIISDGLGGFKESIVDVTTLVSQTDLSTELSNYLSLNGGNMNQGAQVIFNDLSGSTVTIDEYSVVVSDADSSVFMDSGGIYFYANLTQTYLQQNPSATINTVINMPLVSGTLALTSDIINPAGVYLPLAGGTMDDDSQILINASVGSQYSNMSATDFVNFSGVKAGTFNCNEVKFENSSTDTNHSIIPNPSANGLNNVATLPNASGTIALTSQLTTSGISAVGTVNRVIITDGSNLAISSVLLTDLLTASSSVITTLQSDVAGKQATLVSGTNIKTIDGESLLGSGDIRTQWTNSATATHTGDLIRTLVNSFTIPANTYKQADVVEISSMFARNGATIDSDLFIVELDGVTMYSQPLAGANRGIRGSVDMFIKTASGANNVTHWTVNQANLFTSNTSFPRNSTINFTQDILVEIYIELGNVANLCTHLYTSISKK